MAKKVNLGQAYTLKKELRLSNEAATMKEPFIEGSSLVVVEKEGHSLRLTNSDFGSMEFVCDLQSFTNAI